MIGQMFSRAYSIATLNRSTIRETGEDEGALVPAVILVLASSLVAGIVAALLSGISAAMFNAPATGMVTSILQSLIGGLVGLFIGAGIMHLVAAMIFGGQGSFLGLVRAYGHGNGLIGFLNFFPCLGTIAALIWGFVCAVVVVEEWYKLSLGKATAAVAVAFIVSIMIGCGVAMLFGGAALFEQFSKGGFGG